jgi:putative addiction module component (TIGR02574 family)
MSISFEQLKAEAAKLSSTERAELAAELLRSLDPVDDDADPAEIERAWVLEAERRLAEIERGDVQMIPGDESVARIRQLLAGRSSTR